MGFLLLLVATFCAVAHEPEDCTDALINLAPCLDFVTDNTDFPSIDCCLQITIVAHSQPLCFCSVVDGEASELLGVIIDVDRAVTLPRLCDDDDDAAKQVDINQHNALKDEASISPAPVASAPTPSSTP